MSLGHTIYHNVLGNDNINVYSKILNGQSFRYSNTTASIKIASETRFASNLRVLHGTYYICSISGLCSTSGSDIVKNQVLALM